MYGTLAGRGNHNLKVRAKRGSRTASSHRHSGRHQGFDATGWPGGSRLSCIQCPFSDDGPHPIWEADADFAAMESDADVHWIVGE